MVSPLVRWSWVKWKKKKNPTVERAIKARQNACTIPPRPLLQFLPWIHASTSLHVALWFWYISWINPSLLKLSFHNIREPARTWAKSKSISVVWFHSTSQHSLVWLRAGHFHVKHSKSFTFWFIMYFSVFIICNLLLFDQWTWPGHGFRHWCHFTKSCLTF